MTTIRNRIVRHWKAISIGGGCLFAAALLIQSAQGAGLAYSVSASGDMMFVSGDMSWIAGTTDLSKVPPLSCNNEVLAGGYSTRIVSVAQSSFSQDVMLDHTDIMNFTQSLEASTVNGMFMDSLYIEGCGSPWLESTCGEVGEDQEVSSAYSSGASFATYAVGNNLNVNTGGASIQGSVDAPDSMAAFARITGDGSGTITMKSRNTVGFGNSSGYWYDNAMNQQVRADGSNFGVGADFAWESFANLWEVEEVVEEGDTE